MGRKKLTPEETVRREKIRALLQETVEFTLGIHLVYDFAFLE